MFIINDLNLDSHDRIGNKKIIINTNKLSKLAKFTSFDNFTGFEISPNLMQYQGLKKIDLS
jgi:hypothetical protein